MKLKLALGYKDKGNPHDRSSYRFFAQLRSLGKVLERLVASRITQLVRPHLRKSFWGFRPGVGAEDEIAWIRRLQERLHRSSVWALTAFALDFKKAF